MSGATNALPMNPPPAVDVDVSQRALNIVEFLTKAGGLAALFAGVLKWAWKPYVEWRRHRMALLMREVLKIELVQLKELTDREHGCVERMEVMVGQITTLFGEHDMLLEVVYDNRERHDETNQLLDALGFSTDRRSDSDRRDELDGMIGRLNERRMARRRGIEQARANANPRD